MRGSRGFRHGAVIRVARQVRYGALLLALGAGVGVSLVVGSSALGDQLCGTVGDISDCAQWGVDGHAYRLTINDTGTQTISSFVFTMPSGTTANGTAGNASCTANSSTNQVTCTNPIGPGQTGFVEILSNSGVPLGSTGTLTMKDGSGSAQPDQGVMLQSTIICGGATVTSSSGCTTSTPTACTPVELGILKEVRDPSVSSGGNVKRVGTHKYEVGKANQLPAVGYLITVKNLGHCVAKNVVISDKLSPDFAFTQLTTLESNGESAVTVSQPPHFSRGGLVAVRIPTLYPGESVLVVITGRLYDGSEANTANVSATDFAETESSVSLKIVPAPAATIGGADATSVHGSSVAPSGTAVNEDRVAIERSSTGGASDASVSCSWLSNTNGRFVPGACDKPVWLKATGTKHWRLSLRRPLKPGRYFVLAEALGKNGLSADTFRGRMDSGIVTVR